MSDELPILLWAVTGEGPPPPARPDLRKLLSLAYEHRLIPRLLYLLRRMQPAWSSPALLAALQAENARAVVLHQRRIQALREITTAWEHRMGPSAEPLIVVKGFSVFALTGDARHLRLSGDLDLFAPDPEALWQVLTDLGYHGTRHGGKFTEYANLRRAEVAIEIHRFFAVYAYPEGLAAADLTPERNPGVWRQQFGPIRRRTLDHAALRLRARQSEVELCRGLHVPEAALTALLLCAHEFGETLHSPFEIAVPVRLGIVADLLDLMRRPCFDAGRFHHLAAEYGAEDALRCMGAFIQLCGCSVPEALAGFTGAPSRLPRQVGFRGGWAALTTPHEELQPADRTALLHQLGSNRIDPSEDPEAVLPEHVILHSAGAEAFTPRISVRCRPGQLRVEVRLPPLEPERHEYRVRIDGLWPNGPRLAGNVGPWGSTTTGVGRVSPRHEVEDLIVTLELPVSGEVEGALPLLLAVMRRDRARDDFWDADQTAVVPLLVSAPGG